MSLWELTRSIETECGDLEKDVGKFSGMHQTVVDLDESRRMDGDIMIKAHELFKQKIGKVLICVQEPSACIPRPCITRSIDVILGVKFASRDRPKPNAGISKRMLGSFLACIELLWILMSQEGWMATLWPTLMSCSSRRLARYFCTSTVSLYSTAMLARSYRLAWGNVSSQGRPRHTHAPTLQIKPRRNFRVEVIRMRCSKALIHMHKRLWVGARCEGGNTRLEIPREGIGFAYVNAKAHRGLRGD